MKKIIALLLSLLMALGLCACGEVQSDSTTTTTEQEVVTTTSKKEMLTTTKANPTTTKKVTPTTVKANPATTKKATTTKRATPTTVKPNPTTTKKVTTTTAKPKPNVYGVGEKWVVEDQWEFTVNSVKTHKLCNEYSNDGKGYTNEQVVIINYTYKNLGYEGAYMNLFLSSSSFDVYDEEGESAETYACTHEKNAKECIVGTKCTAEEAYVLSNDSSEIVLAVEHYTSNDTGEAKATFNLSVTEPTEEEKAEQIGYSRVKGEFTYKYNNFVGHRGDSGTKVLFVPKNPELKTKAEKAAMMLTGEKYDSGIIVEKCDAYGKFDTGIDYIPAGDYVVVVVSGNTRQAGQVTADTLRPRLGEYLSDENLETLALFIGFSKVAIDDMKLEAKYEHSISNDFGTTYF